MDRRNGVLLAIQSNPAEAEAILRAAFQADPDGVIRDLADYLIAALSGCVPDPGDF